MNLALKEWATVIRALELGKQILILRKGGISESGGDFEMEHSRFLLYPTFEHQNPAMIKSDHLKLYQTVQEERRGNVVRITSFAEAHKILQVRDRSAIDRLTDLHIWESPYIDLRFNYKPDRPLYVAMLRTYLLATPLEFTETTEYVGCRSWVQLAEQAQLEGSSPVLDDQQFNACVSEVLRLLDQPVTRP